MRSLLRAWQNYWFRPAPLTNLAIARLVVVGLQVFLLIAFHPQSGFPDLVKLPDIYNPVAILRFVLGPFDRNWFPSLATLNTIYWATVAFGVLAFVGLLTNVSLAFFAFGSTMMQAYMYSFNDFHHGEAIMAFALAFLALSPCGRQLSLDTVIVRLRETIRRRKFEGRRPLEETSDAARWAPLALLWILSLVYASAAYYKIGVTGLDWLNGHTLRYYLLQDGLRWDIPAALWLAHHQWPAIVMSAGSLAFEALFFLTLIFPVLIWPFAIAGFGMHLGIHFLMEANFWEFMAMYLAVVPWTLPLARVRARLEARRAGKKPRLIYDGECFLCLRSMVVVDELDWTGKIAYAPFQDPEARKICDALGITPADTRRELQLLLPEGGIRKGFFAVRRMAWYLPPLIPFAPFLYLPGMSFIGPRGYRFVAERRRRFESCGNDACRLDHY